ncbi:GNAT family N-acetyltransferase [Agromyces sp. H66]|uniref:GNAT family N-acetyltransferase n=1 Tax=Agromyces sp. H66 TaxID=2529859 RepID=UPI0010AAE3D6|nr:GNAT family N-acetyltransferase [Agromyces sp. H66]
MTTSPRLPADLTTRPLTREDSRPAFELIAAQEREDTGRVNIEEADLVSGWSRPSHDLAARSIAVLDGDRIVAYGELVGHDRAAAAVHPEWRGRGIGTWIADWIRQAARRGGSDVVGMPVFVGSAGDRLLAGLGYHVRWNSWVLELPEGTEIPRRALPPGYAIGEAGPADLRAMHDVLEDAFLEWSRRARESFEDFTASVLERPGFEPWNLRVVTDDVGDVVGAAVVVLADDTAYVDRLATRADRRNRGIAQALLVDAFVQGRAHGATVSELSTDSRTGALGLYEKVGMVVTSNYVNRAIHL